MQPPLRHSGHQKALWAALRAGPAQKKHRRRGVARFRLCPLGGVAETPGGVAETGRGDAVAQSTPHK